MCESRKTITLTANLDALAQITAFITAAAEQLGLDERATWQVQLAVDEAATNIIQYAYDAEKPGDIVVDWCCVDECLVIRLCDHGRQFDPQAIAPPNLELPLEERQVGGLGIYLMTRLMDEVRFDFDPEAGNLLTLVKNLSTTVLTDVTLLPLHGRIDAVTSPQMSAEIRARIDAGTRYLLLDLSDVSFMSSSGLRALLLIRKNLMTLGGELRLAALPPQVMEIFDITGFAQVFAIHTSLDEAQDAFGQGRT